MESAKPRLRLRGQGSDPILFKVTTTEELVREKAVDGF